MVYCKSWLDSGCIIWRLGLWMPGGLDPGRLDTWIVDARTVVTWDLDAWTRHTGITD